MEITGPISVSGEIQDAFENAPVAIKTSKSHESDVYFGPIVQDTTNFWPASEPFLERGWFKFGVFSSVSPGNQSPTTALRPCDTHYVRATCTTSVRHALAEMFAEPFCIDTHHGGDIFLFRFVIRASYVTLITHFLK